MQIVEKFCVGEQCFNTKEEALTYIENSAERIMIDAFVEFKRAGGAQRVNTSTIEEYLDFVRSQQVATPAPEAPKQDAEEAAEVKEVETPTVDETPAEEPVPQPEEEKESVEPVAEEPVVPKSQSLFARP